MLGFGFNKTKILSSAERYVQQGKLQSAIAEYEKVVERDAKDLTVLNTIGDLYARLGNTQQALTYFKRVGDAYAADGFTVKAIAMYKKLSKLDPGAAECTLKLAELYTQQGLYNDARSQYLHVAEQFMRGGKLDLASKIFLKMLEFDPENTAMQSKLADLLVRQGKKEEARDIFLRSAESLYGRGALEAADEALGRVLQLDPGNVAALLKRGQIALDSSNAADAIAALSKVPDLDSRPDALRSLLRAHVMLGHVAEIEPLSRKLLSLHNDIGGITSYADALIAGGEFIAALHVFEGYADRLLAADAKGMAQALHALIARVKDKVEPLELLCRLLGKAGDSSHLPETMELLAHAYVHADQLAKARDIYKQLSELEPENPLHAQNYKQVLAKLGEDASVRELTPEEGAQAFLVDELEPAPPAVAEHYPIDIAEAIKSALTDSELFDSYNLPAKAVEPLEAVLGRVPRDPQLNQRLASLYARANRFADAARCCQILYQVYLDSGNLDDARHCADLIARYRERAGLPPLSPEAMQPPVAAEEPPASAVDTVAAFPAGEESVTEFTFDEVPLAEAEPETEAVPTTVAEPVPAPPPAEVEPEVEQESAVAPPPGTHEIDLSAEWESMAGSEAAPAVVEPAPVEAAPEAAPEFAVVPEPAAEPVEEIPPPAPAPVTAAEPVAPMASAPEEETPAEAAQAVVAEPAPNLRAEVMTEVVDEIKYYLAQGQWADAAAAIARCESLAPDHPELNELRAYLESGRGPQPGPAPEVDQAAAAPVADLVEEIKFYLSQSMWQEADAAIARCQSVAPALPELADFRAQLTAGQAAQPAQEIAVVEVEEEIAPVEQAISEVSEPVAVTDAAPEAVIEQPVEAEPIAAATEPVEPAAASHRWGLELESVAAAQAPLSPAEGAPVLDLPLPEEVPAETAVAATHIPSPDEPLPEIAAQAPLGDVIPEPGPAVSEDVLGGFVLDLEASLGDDFALGGKPEAQRTPAPVFPPPLPPSMPAAVASAAPPKGEPLPAPMAAAAAPALAPETPPVTHEEATSALADLFAEFKEDVESGADQTEDPETHYNLGVAFKEMGLLDEAIGELQKVCQSIEHGRAFPQTMQAYTWLAHCFVEKGVPEAGIRWYEKALKLSKVEDDTAMAVHYELASAYEAAGNKQAALAHFMEVYGVNIDYRDVAERIKALRS